ncbi:MAG: hypothetical protein EPN38_09180 [Rhodanobacteraceae bacterium]|nr:MAG: hypothetical protein EPN38_09180 [Rhodanobacteraceae bacterium]
MKTLTACVVAVLALAAVSSVHAANPDKAVVTRDFTDTIAPAEMQAYGAGVKTYNQCLREHGITFNEYAVTHETGANTYQVSYDVGPTSWAQQDALDAAAKPCDATFHTQVDPHLKNESSTFMVEQPDMSHMPGNWRHRPPPKILHVINYTLKPGRNASMAFTDAVKKIAAAAVKTKWPYYWDTVAIEGGGEDAPDFQVAIGSQDWAEAGADPSPSLWKMVANAYGQKEADAIRSALDTATLKSTDHFDRYDTDLSYIAGK